MTRQIETRRDAMSRDEMAQCQAAAGDPAFSRGGL